MAKGPRTPAVSLPAGATGPPSAEEVGLHRAPGKRGAVPRVSAAQVGGSAAGPDVCPPPGSRACGLSNEQAGARGRGPHRGPRLTGESAAGDEGPGHTVLPVRRAQGVRGSSSLLPYQKEAPSPVGPVTWVVPEWTRAASKARAQGRQPRGPTVSLPVRRACTTGLGLPRAERFREIGPLSPADQAPWLSPRRLSPSETER